MSVEFNKFTTYFETIGLAEPLKQKVFEIWKAVEIICPEPLLDLFVCDYLTQDRVRKYEGLFIFSEKYLIEIENFISTGEMGIIRIADQRKTLQFQYKNYDFSAATTDSELSITLYIISDSWRSYFKSSGLNCDKLLELSKKYFIN
ncbi:hypothetical protein FBR05_01755 [Deltaproteobacteria bacterium PRO3]|nr:hypothetical protein [Deltaproteobacteria bacterium PRO3]